MNRIIIWLFSHTRLGKLVDGKKTLIGAILTALSALLWTLEKIAPMYPDVAWLGQAAGQLQALFPQVEEYLATVGLSSLTIGLVHKDAKKKAGIR